MDYLHGDVVDNEFEAACYYEYARESTVLHGAARSWASKKHSDKETEEILLEIERRFLGAGTWWSHIWCCPSFPQQAWNQLNQHERADILLWFRPSQNPSFFVNAVYPLYPTIEGPIFQSSGEPQLKKEPLQWIRALFTLGFSTTRKQLVREFDQWLQRPENKARFDAHERNPTGKTGSFNDRLKDLAAWRLYRELGCKEALEFAEKNRKHDEYGTARKFHDARKEQSKTKMPPNEAPLYSEESGFLRAKARVERQMAKWFPWE